MKAERQLAAAALGDSEERIRGIVNTAVEGIITIDERGVVQSMNPAAEKLFGWSAEEMIGKNVSTLMPSPYREGHDGYLKNYEHTGKAKIIGIGREVVGQRKDGSVFPMDLSVGEGRLANGKLFTGIVRDITERKRMEKDILEISDREQQRIGQDLHDDLCQSLAGIELMSELLQEKLAATSNPESVQAARIAEHVQRAIEQTRMVARGLSPLETEATGLMAALGELAANTERLFHVRCWFVSEQPVNIAESAAATHLYRIAQEAINNAIKHGKATEITISLKEDDGQIILSITDNGAGFSPPQKTNEGMGLRIMKYRAGVIGGTLDVKAAGTQGTVVTCAFRQAPLTGI